MSQKNIQKKTLDSKSNVPSKPSTSQNQISKNSDEKVIQKQNLVANKNVKTSLSTINKNNIKLKTNSNTTEVKKTITNKAKPTQSNSNSFKNEIQRPQQNSKPSQKNKEIVKKDKTILDEKQKRLKVVEQNDSKKKIIDNKNLTKGEPKRTAAQIVTNKVSSNESNLLLATLETNTSYKQFPGRSSESILAEPPSIRESELDEFINNITDNQSDDYGSDYYDDFEDYESDFEDDDEDDEEQNDNKESISAKTFDNNLLINKNEKLFQFEDHLNNNEKTLKFQHSVENSENGFSSRQTKSRIESAFLSINDMRSAQMKSESKVHMNKAIKRANELLEIIKLNKVGFINCDLPPINYDIFIKTFGRRDAKQVSCQTCERQSIQIQTENVSRINKWTQNPSFSRIDAGKDDEENKITCLVPNIDPFKLSKFLIKAETIMNAIIDCEYNKYNKTALPSGAEKFSKSYSTLKCLDLAKKCPISYTFTNSIYLFCVQNVTKTVGSAEKSVIVVWNLLSEKPQNRAEKVLICRSHIVCAHSEDSIVVAAMIDGSVALWDLNEEPHHHKQIIVDNHKFVLRSPSYNSATTGNGHNRAVVAITRISYYDLDQNSSHFATIDEMGFLIIWAFVEVKGDSNDFGVSPTSHWRLTRNSIIKCLDKFEFETKVSVTSFECQPNDCSQFYCGTDNGLVIRCSTCEEVVNHLPNIYKNSELNSFWTSVNKINFNKSSKNSFLVGYSDGSIAYYSITSENPLTLLQTNYSPIIDLKWLSDKNCSFIAFNKSNQIFIYDLMSDDTNPLVSYRHPNNRLLSMSLWKGMETKLLFGCDCGNVLVFTFNHLLINDS